MSSGQQVTKTMRLGSQPLASHASPSPEMPQQTDNSEGR